MAKGKVILSNKFTQMKKEAPIGFSWTVLFFGFFPPVFRGDWKWFIVMLLLHMVTVGISSLVLSFFYNKLHIKDLLKDGYRVVGASYTDDLAIIAGDLDMPLSVITQDDGAVVVENAA